MAKQITLKIDADTGALKAKLQEIPKEIAKQVTVSSELTRLDASRNSLLTKQKELITAAEAKMAEIAGKDLNNGLKVIQLNRSLQETNKELQAISLSLSGVIEKSNNLKLATNLGTVQGNIRDSVRPSTPFNYGTGAPVVQQQIPAAAPKVDATTLQRTTADIGFSLISGATKAANIIKDAEKSLGDKVVSVAKVDARTIEARQIPTGFNFGTGAIAKQATEQDKVTAAVNKTKTAVDGLVSTHKSLLTHIGEVLISYRALNTAINLVEQALLNIPKAGIALESTTASLTASFGSTTGAIKELEFLNSEAKRTGLSIQVLRESYQQAAASFIAAGESADTTRTIFANLNTMSTTLHLNSDKTSSIYLALSQIFNKTKLQAEELTKQLSQTIPGVTNEQAKALGITVSDLYDRMKKGAISAHEAVLALSETLARDYGGEAFKKASTGLNAELGRVQTSWTLLSENIYKVSSVAMTSVLKTTAEVIDSLAKLFENTKQVSDIFITLASTLGGALAGYTAVKTASLLLNSTLVTTVAQVGGLKLAWTSLGEVFSRNIFTGTIVALTTLGGYLSSVKNNVVSLRDQAAALRSEQAASDTTKPIEFRVENTKAVKDAKATVDAQRKVLAQLENPSIKDRIVHAFSNDIETAPTRVNIARAKKDLATFYDAYKREIVKAQKDLAITDVKTQENILPQTPKIEDIKAPKIKSVGAAAANKEATDYYKDLIRDSKLASQEIESSLKSMDKAYSNNIISIKDYFEKKKELQIKDIEQQIDANNKGIELAKKRNDSAKVEEFTDKNEALKQKLKDVAKVVAEDETQAFLNLGDILRQTSVDYAELIGDTETFSKLSGPTKLIEDLNYLKAQLDSIDKSSVTGQNITRAIQQKETLIKEAALKTNVTSAQKDFNKILDYSAAKEKQIFQQQQEGFLSQEQALKQLTDLRGQLAAKAYDELSVIEQSANKSEDLSLKLDAIIAKSKFKDSFGPSNQAFNQATQSNSPTGQVIDIYKNSSNQQTALKAEQLKAIQDLQDQYYVYDLEKNSDYQDKLAAINNKYGVAQMASHTGMYTQMASVAASSFESMYQSAAAMYGAQSKEARKAFAAYKAMKLAEVTLSSIQAVMSAYASGVEAGGAAGPIVGPIMAGIAAAFGAVQIAQVASMQPPAAHGGLTNVPKEQTYLLDRGERVLSPNQNRDLTNYLGNAKMNQQPQAPDMKVRIINSVDPSLMNDYLGSDEGERVVMNIVRKNKAA